MSASPVLVLSVANRAVRSGGVSALSDSEQADGVSQNRFPLHRGVIAVACNVSSKTKRRKQTYLLYKSHNVLELPGIAGRYLDASQLSAACEAQKLLHKGNCSKR